MSLKQLKLKAQRTIKDYLQFMVVLVKKMKLTVRCWRKSEYLSISEK